MSSAAYPASVLASLEPAGDDRGLWVNNSAPKAMLEDERSHNEEAAEELLRRAVQARLDDFPQLPEDVREAAIARFLEIRGREIRKPPAGPTAPSSTRLRITSTA